MKHTKKLTITLFCLTFLINTISVDAAARYGMLRYVPTSLQAAPVFGLSEVHRFYSQAILDKRIYAKEDIAQFPEFNLSHEDLVRSNNDNAELFIPPLGNHYAHPRYNMNIYEKGKKLFSENIIREMETHQKENYLYPDINTPRLVKNFLSLPFSASGSLWAYLSLQDYIDNNPCWSGSASLVTPYCALTAAHCLIAHETRNKQPAVYAFVLHHYGNVFSTKIKCLGYRVSENWKNNSRIGVQPDQTEDFGIVFFKPITVKHGILKLKSCEEKMVGKKVEITGYPGDSIALRARKIWPSNFDHDVGYFFPLMNQLPYVMRKFGYDVLSLLGYLEVDKFAGCLMYSSPGKIIFEEDKMVSYDANTFSGQSGGNGVALFQYKDSDAQENDVILDFIHTLGSPNPKFGNSGVKIEGDVTKKILMWSSEAINAIKTAISSSVQSAQIHVDTKSEILIKKLLKINKLTIEEISEITGARLEQIEGIRAGMTAAE
jgi:V8-like Glu-specific endopeptidase